MMHKFSTNLSGDSAAALKKAQDMMVMRGFAVSKVSAGEVRGTRSHPFMGGKTSDMIALVSELVIRASSSQLSAEAELGTFKKLIVFLIVLIGGLESLFLVLGFTVTENRMLLWISLLTVAPWLIIGPAMLIAFRAMALREVRTFLENVAAMSEND